MRGRPGPRFPLPSYFLADELSVPAQQRVGRHEGVELLQGSPAELFALGSQQASLFVGETDPPSPFLQLLFEHLVLCKDVLESLVLLAVQKTGDGDGEDEPGIKDRSHGSIVASRSR